VVTGAEFRALMVGAQIDRIGPTICREGTKSKLTAARFDRENISSELFLVPGPIALQVPGFPYSLQGLSYRAMYPTNAY